MNDDIIYDKMRDELVLLETTPSLPANMETNMACSNHSLWWQAITKQEATCNIIYYSPTSDGVEEQW